MLAVLAGDRTFEVSEGLEALGAGLAEHPDLGLEARHVEACTGLAQVVAKWVAAQRQAQALRGLLREGDPPLQTLTQGMASLVEHYRRTHENERSVVIGLLEVELAYADRPQEQLLATLGKAHLQTKVREYELAEASYADAQRGLRAIQDGHRRLLANVDRLSGGEVRATLERLTRDLQTIRRKLEVAHVR
jgi:septation ring formation regulator EzrA